MSNIVHGTFVLTDACNLACTYCFVKQRPVNMTEETAKRGVDFLIQNAIATNSKKIGITFFGGEPTLRLDLMNFIFDYSKSQSNLYNLAPPDYSLITNGMLFNEELESFLLKWKAYTKMINVQLSLDGPPDIETSQRISKTNVDSGVIMEENLAKIYNFCYKNNINVGQEVFVHSVITRKTLPRLFDIYKYFCEHKFPGLWYQLMNDEDWRPEDVDIYKEQLELIYNYYRDNDLMEYMVGNKSFDSDVKCYNCHSAKACEAGNKACAIDPNGGIHICHRFYCDSPELQLGDLYKDPIIYNTSVKEYYESIVIADMIGEKPCKDCEDSNCRKCIAVNEAYNKVPTLCFPKYCMMIHAERDFKLKLARHLNAMFNKSKIGESKLIALRNYITFIERSLNRLAGEVENRFNSIESKQDDMLALLLANYMKEEKMVDENLDI